MYPFAKGSKTGETDAHLTLAQVKDRLQSTLITNTNTPPHNPSSEPKSSGPDQLLAAARQYAIAAFQKEFGYDYNGGSTTPPDAISPVELTAADGIYSPTDKERKDIGGFMKKMLKDQKPSWMHDQAQIDLLKRTEGIAGTVTGNNWKHIALIKTYNPQDESKQNSVRTNTIIVFVNGSLKINNFTANKTVVYYVGVYYQVITPLVAARQKLKTDAYNQASPFMNNNEAIGDDTSLTTALELFSKTRFEEQFPYKWGENSPDHVDGPFLKTSANALGYFEDGYTDGVQTFVKNKLLKGLPGWTSDTVISDVVGTFTNLITNVPPNGSWSSLKFDQTYDDSNGVDNSLTVNAVLVYYVDSKTTESGTKAKISYIFWMGTSYEKPSPASEVYSNIIKEVYDNLHGTMSDVSDENLEPNKEGLITLLSRCAASRFKSEYGYDFNVGSMNPTGSNGDKVYPVECFGEFKDVTTSAVSAWTKDEIFKDGPFATNDLKLPLDEQIVWWLGQKTNLNIWSVGEYKRRQPSNNSKVINTAAIAIYANGQSSGRGITVKSNFIYYAGVHYEVDDDNSEEGGESDPEDV